jgi:hypothetical protein
VPRWHLDAMGDVAAADEAEQLIAMLRAGAMTWDEEPVLTWERPSSNVRSRSARGFVCPSGRGCGQHLGGVGLPGGKAGDPVDGLGLADRVPPRSKISAVPTLCSPTMRSH